MARRLQKASTVMAALAGIATLIQPIPTDAAPIESVGHRGMAWTVTDASGAQPPHTFGGGGSAMWGGSDRIWNQPGFTGSYRISFDGAVVAGYCGDFHNAKSPDADSTWTPDRAAFAGSDKALTKLSYAQWRWGATADPDTGAALNLYTHFLGSPGDRSNRSGVPIPDINDNDILDEVVTTLPPHSGVSAIMYEIDEAAEAWSEAFDHRSENVTAGLTVEVVDGAPVVTSAATGAALPAGTYDLDARPRTIIATTAGTARPLRDTTAGSQNSITAGGPQSARVGIGGDIEVTSQISDTTPSIDTELSDAIRISGLVDGETATVRIELFDLTVDPTGAGSPLADETRADLGNGTTKGWAPMNVSLGLAGHRLGYRHRLQSVDPSPPAGQVVPGQWSDLGVASETGVVADVHAQVHLRKTVSSSRGQTWINAQREAPPSHDPAAAPDVAARGSHDNQRPDNGDGIPVFIAGDDVSFRYEVWLDPSSTGVVAWGTDANTDANTDGVVIDDGGTPAVADDFAPTYLSGDDGDGRLALGEVWIFEADEQRRALPGERYTNVATVQSGVVINPATNLRTDENTEVRVDPAGYIVPCLSTAVADRSDGDRVLDREGGSVVDVATYCNLVPGDSYVIDAAVMVAETGAATDFTGSVSFVPDTPDGSVEVEIVVDIDQTDVGTVGDFVVFQTVRSATSGDVVVSHTDLDDTAQTFTIASAAQVVVPVPVTTPVASIAPPVTTPVAEIIPPVTTPVAENAPPVTTPVAENAPPVTTPVTSVAPPAALPPTADRPPSIPKVGSDATDLLVLSGLALFTMGVVLLEARHGRIRREPKPRPTL